MSDPSTASQPAPGVKETPVPMKTMTDYLIRIGADKIPHTNKTYLAHAIGTYRKMKSWGESDALCCAAMFHSIYGTEGFQDFTLPLDQRDELRALIGDYAELLAYANCAMDRASFHALADADLDPYPVQDRLTGGSMDLSRQEYEDLMRVHLCDFLEQVERTAVWDHERQSFIIISERLSGAALEAYRSTFAREP
jgi:hypothetical protein